MSILGALKCVRRREFVRRNRNLNTATQISKPYHAKTKRRVRMYRPDNVNVNVNHPRRTRPSGEQTTFRLDLLVVRPIIFFLCGVRTRQLYKVYFQRVKF